MKLLELTSRLNLKNKRVLFFIVPTIVLVMVVFILITNVGKEKEKMQNFSNLFQKYQVVESDLAVKAMLPIVDYSEEICEEEMCGKENFFSYLTKALDFYQTGSYRAKNAQMSIDSYNNFNKRALDLYSESISLLDNEVSEMIQVASSLEDEKNKDLALSIAKKARKLQDMYEELRINEISIFTVRLDLMKKLVDNNGTPPDLEYLKKGGNDVVRLGEEQTKLYEELKKLKQEIQDSFLIFKGNNDL